MIFKFQPYSPSKPQIQSKNHASNKEKMAGGAKLAPTQGKIGLNNIFNPTAYCNVPSEFTRIDEGPPKLIGL